MKETKKSREQKEEAKEQTKKRSMIFSGLVYVLVGILILLYPRLVYFWVSGGFLVQGISSLIRAWKT